MQNCNDPACVFINLVVSYTVIYIYSNNSHVSGQDNANPAKLASFVCYLCLLKASPGIGISHTGKSSGGRVIWWFFDLLVNSSILPHNPLMIFPQPFRNGGKVDG